MDNGDIIDASKLRGGDIPGVLDLSQVFKEAAVGLEKAAEKFSDMVRDVKLQLLKVEKEQCVEHGIDLEFESDLIYGKMWQTGKLIVAYKECSVCVSERKKSLVNDKLKEIGIPNKTRHATLDNFELQDKTPELVKARKLAHQRVRLQAEKGYGFIVMLGKVGTGKTHLASAVAMKFSNSIFVTQADMIGQLRNTYSNNLSQDELVAKYRKPKVLVIDELSNEVKGVDIAAFLYRIISYRHDNALLTIITSNETFEDVKEILGPKLVDRIKESCVQANFTWDSARKPEQ